MSDVCPNCQSKSGVDVHGREFCHACKKDFSNKKSLFKKPERKSKRLELPVKLDKCPDDLACYLGKYYLQLSDMAKYKLFWNDWYGRLCFPIMTPVQQSLKTVKLSGVWMRCINHIHKTGDYCQAKWLYAGDPELIYFQSYRSGYSSVLVLVEDCISCLRVSEFFDCLALGGTSLTKQAAKDKIADYKTIVLWLDGDFAGRMATTKLRNKLKLSHKVIIIRTKKDPKEYSPSEMKSLLLGETHD